MAGCCGCCSALRPRYRKLVDNIYPADPQDGLVRNNMEKLTFYALSSPEKLDRIGEYLAWRVSRDITRRKIGYVIISMEAMDQLLVACHAQTLNLFVESFLKMVQRLLECTETDLQLLATQSFIKFANIEEDTPSYHRSYDFFISKFSSLCHNDNPDPDIKIKLRVAGLKGLQGVVRKTVSDDLQVNIWDETHMEKIIPSLLFNMQNNSPLVQDHPDSPQEETTPWTLAENCLREIIGRATFGHVRSIVQPVLKHLDNHDLWEPIDFAVRIFKIIVYSIQAQYSYSVIQILMGHLDDNCKDELDGKGDKAYNQHEGKVRIRTGIVNVLANIVSITAGESIGPSVLEIFNSLLKHLRHSINVKNGDQSQEEKNFQESVINTLGEFANNLPDFQKIEIMMFIMGKIPLPSHDIENSETDTLLQHILLKSLLKVGTKYRTLQLAQAFPPPFLQPLLQMSLASDPEVRVLVQRILHTLLDRHNNLPHLTVPSCEGDPLVNLTVEKCSRQDTMFMKKHGPEILMHLYEAVVNVAGNTADNYHAVYTTLALLCVELGSEEVIIDLLRLIFALQDVAGNLSAVAWASVHSLVAGFLHILGHLTAIPALNVHFGQVIKARRDKAPYLLPTAVGISSPPLPETGVVELSEDLLFDKMAIAEALRSSGHDTSRLLQPFMVQHHTSAGGDVTTSHSISDLNSISVEVDSVASSPGVTRKQPPEEEITVESLKKMLAEPVNAQKDVRRLQIVEEFRTAAFEDLVAKSEQQSPDLHNKLTEIFSKLPPVTMDVRPSSPPATNPREECHRAFPPPPVYAFQFPDLFVF